MTKHRWNGDCEHVAISSPARGYMFNKLFECEKCHQVSTVSPYNRSKSGRTKQATKLM